MKFELFYKFKHCTGDSIYNAGIVSSPEEATEWVKQNFGRKSGGETFCDTVAEECMAEFCPMKDQKPFFFYRKIEE
jgi:hypothetical protein